MAPNSCLFENFMFDQFSTEDILLHENSDPDKQFYNNSSNFYDTPYFSPNETKGFLKQSKNDNFSILNVRSLNKNTESCEYYFPELYI